MDILKLFQYNQKLKFTDIGRALKTKSNKLAYHLKNLTKKGLLIKDENYYCLSETSEHLIPYLSEKNSTLAVILILIGNRNKCFLITRNKRPFKGRLALPGGRLLVGESIKQAAERIMKEKFNVNAKFIKINSISLEHVRKNNKTVHSFLLILVEAKTKDKINFTNVTKNKKKIISSDYQIITSKDKEIKKSSERTLGCSEMRTSKSISDINIKTFHTPA